jgi:hypothetical protein
MVEPTPGTGIALAFDAFGWGELSAEARASRCSETELVNAAISEYLASLAAGDWSQSGQVPDFARKSDAKRPGRIEVELTSEQIQGLRAEAARQGVSVPQLVVHAVLLRLGQS